MSTNELSVSCAGCGAVVDASEPLPFACVNRDEGDIDHVLRYAADTSGIELPAGGAANPFVRYRRLMWIWQAARARGMSDEDYVRLATELDARVSDLDGRGFCVTPYALASELGVFFKDETHNVGGSHKARHLMGIALHLAVIEASGAAPWTSSPALAIASCGNAALAAAVVARAANRTLKVFIPAWANPAVVASLTDLGAELIVCERGPDDPPGDPCYQRFRAAVAAGALPFSCQGPDNGLAIDGGRTLGFEIAAQHCAAAAPPLTHLFVQIGGGALASSLWQGFELAAALDPSVHLPALVAVQTEGGHPLVRAWNRVVAAGADRGVTVAAARLHRSAFMWPWETEPISMATGILDDETYDWWQVLRGLAASGGDAILASEADIGRAGARARDIGLNASPTGVAGFAGLLARRAVGALVNANPAVLFTGVQR